MLLAQFSDGKFKASKAVKEKLEGILNEETDQSQITEPEDAVNILIKNLSFTYPGTTLPVLKNISLSLSKHQKIALIGSSGSGKSTLGKLLCGYFDTYEGSIQGDGRKLKRTHPPSRRASGPPHQRHISGR